VRVQDPFGNPVQGVRLSTNPVTADHLIGSVSGLGNSGYPRTDPSPATTGADGTVDLWLFTTANGAPYAITADPPAGSPYQSFTITDVSVAGDRTLVVVLEFVHAPPVTTATLTPAPDSGGVYREPVTVRLDAVAAEGAAIDATYYRVDGGPEAVYSGPFVVDTEGTHTVSFWSIDELGVYGAPQTVTFDIVLNQPPVADAGGPYSVAEGSSVTLDAAGSSDPDDNIASYDWDLNGDGVFDDASGVSVSYAGVDDGVYPVSVKVTDLGGEFDTATASVTVTNVAPAVTVSVPSVVSEGDTAVMSGTYSDPGVLDTHTAAIDWGDGTVEDLGSVASPIDRSHRYLDDGTYPAALSVTDDDGGVGADSGTITVENVAPVLGAVSGPSDPVEIGTSIGVSVPFTDAGVLDTHTAVVDWGDGTSSSGIVTEDHGTGTVSAAHSYGAPGVYTATVTVDDGDGGVASATFEYVVVFDPGGGFVTGGGWIWSPAGAYTADPLAEGKATFGFVAKYKKGAKVPDGNTQFQFKAGGLSFSSTSYDWLVVAGAKAQYKGVGTINGKTGFGFMLTARDSALPGGGTSDTFRIKIWSIASGGVVYDNQPGADVDADPTTALGGGSIVIHK